MDIADSILLRLGSKSAERGAIAGLLAMLQARDARAFTDSHAVAAWCERLTERLGLSPATRNVVVKSAVLHDVGNVALPDAVLRKRSALTGAEWTVMQQHAQTGAEILARLPALAQYAPVVRAHHERWDGSGYPAGLKGPAIPIEARIIAVADAFHAMISERPHRAARTQRDAIAILRDGRGAQWDPTVIDAMISLLQAPRTDAGERYVALH